MVSIDIINVYLVKKSTPTIQVHFHSKCELAAARSMVSGIRCVSPPTTHPCVDDISLPVVTYMARIVVLELLYRSHLVGYMQ